MFGLSAENVAIVGLPTDRLENTFNLETPSSVAPPIKTVWEVSAW